MVCHRKNINDVLYIQIISNNSLIDKVYSIKIDPGNYHGNDLANELTRKSNIAINDIPNTSFFNWVDSFVSKFETAVSDFFAGRIFSLTTFFGLSL